MNNAWELRQDDERTADNLYTFVIFCEDEISEYYYFKWFETPLIKINIIRKQKSMLTSINKSIAYCTSNGILIFENNKYSIKDDGIQIWCVYDRDIESNPCQINEKDHEFNISISLAEQHDILVAWSNDAFELWILLHLMEISPEIEEAKSRTYYYEQLTDYFNNKEKPNEELEKAKSHKSFSYKKDLKSKNNFISIVRDEIIPHTYTAIKRSEKLFDFFISKPNHFEKKPCTNVHSLVKSLLEKGKKEIPRLGRTK